MHCILNGVFQDPAAVLVTDNPAFLVSNPSLYPQALLQPI